MPGELERSALWQRTLADQSDGLDAQRGILRHAFLRLRERVAHLVGEIGGVLPDLTVHDVTHLDALWRVADEIAGADYPMNPAEGFVLGSAFLLHDAAHVLAAYEGGLAGIKQTTEWADFVAYRFNGIEPSSGSPQERSVLFHVLRHLHARQAHALPKTSWLVPSTGERLYLLEHFEVRSYYGDLIGEIAASHHWSAHAVTQRFERRHVSAPAFLAPATWSVDALKVAFLLRTADAAHIDGLRAPWFLFALRNPDGISQLHWKFQAKMGQPRRTDRGELRLNSGSPFSVEERQAWWLAYETARMIDSELRAAATLMRDSRRLPFAATCVEHVQSPETFAGGVQARGWEPIDVQPQISDVGRVIGSLGGAAIYGNRPDLALRELIQNAADAVRALRSLGGLEQHEGRIDISLTRDGNVTWLHVTDTGIGMSRYVLTKVLLDFGNSLWSSEAMLTELPGLASKGFRAVGRFGIGFFSVFMLGSRVVVATRRFKTAAGDNSDQWLLEFDNELAARPTLRRPTRAEDLPRVGTRVSVAMKDDTVAKLLSERTWRDRFEDVFPSLLDQDPVAEEVSGKGPSEKALHAIVASLCPTLDVEVRTSIAANAFGAVVLPHDWRTLTQKALLARLYPHDSDARRKRLIDLREPSGELVGRVGYTNDFFTSAVMTHRGIHAGTVSHLVGILLAHNSTDLARRQSAPVASKAAWEDWADRWIRSSRHVSANDLAPLQPLIARRDLAVYRLNDERLNTSQLVKWLRSQSEVLVCDAWPIHDDFRDDVSGDAFERRFESREDILFLPEAHFDLPEALGLSPIDYEERFEATLRSTWQELEIYDEDNYVVGDVDGVEICRSILRYTRVHKK